MAFDILMAVKCETRGPNHQDKLPPHSWLTETVKQNKRLLFEKKLKSFWCFVRFRNSKFWAFFSTLFSLSFDIRWKFTCIAQKIFEWLVPRKETGIYLWERYESVCVYIQIHIQNLFIQNIYTHIQNIYTHINNIYTHIQNIYIHISRIYIYIYTCPYYIYTYPEYMHISRIYTDISRIFI